MRLTLCMIVKDEEEVLERCLSSVAALVEEAVIVDTGSSDGTKKIAKKYGYVYDLAWEDDFAKARNFSFSKASGDYLLWLDADDVLPPDEAKKFPSLLEEIEKTGADTVMCPYRSGRLEYLRERIVRNCPDAKWRGHVHECIPPFGKILCSDLTVTHLPKQKKYTMRNLHIYEKWATKEPLRRGVVCEQDRGVQAACGLPPGRRGRFGGHPRPPGKFWVRGAALRRPLRSRCPLQDAKTIQGGRLLV